ncbi:MAG: PSD1 and planctomycete cytochrome C domain-containing protein [Planctomycetaceae bacterium]
MLSISHRSVCVLVSVSFFIGGAIRAEDKEPDAAGVEFFEKNVRPLLVANCYECHSAEEKKGGLVLEFREGILKGGDNGPAIVAGDPEKSLFIEAVRYKNRDLQMPPKKALPEAEIAILEKWVAMGAPDPRSEVKPVKTGPVGMSIEEGRQFWAFMPVVKHPVPAVRDANWVQTPIDAFILAKLEEQGLQPAPTADKLTLIRRATFDLVGLPPTPQEIEDFLNDDTPDAFKKVVDRLLNSPQYGVRWGRHWLDVARYADSNGLDENLAYGNAWRYRDYVVNSFNNDKPFNRFVVEQIAGDLIPEANQETKTGTGFLVLGAKVLAEPDREKLNMDTIDEQLDTMGKAFMGLTIGCARCHDHKFDPIKQSDYYALGAIFKSTKTFGETTTGIIKHWYEHSFTTPEEQAKLKEVDAAIAAKASAAATFKSAAIAKIQSEARSKATDYLLACTKFNRDMDPSLVLKIAEQLGLHPRMLHHCRLHLAYHQDDPFFGKWHELVAAGDIAGIETHYRPLFEGAEIAWAAAQKAEPKVSTLADPQLELARLALYDTAGFLAVPSQPQFAFDPATLAEYYRLMDEARIAESTAPDSSAAMGVGEGAISTTLPIHIRGNYLMLGEPIARGFPEVMRYSNVNPIFPLNQSGRLELAEWMASTQHPLTARVYVNRVWRWHFGAGIVPSTENFGRLGDRPSHPELFDWLAYQFMETGWSTKDLHRLIMASSAYQMASSHANETASFGVDPENRLLWKFRIQRLEAEQVRDSILAVSGRLDESINGKTVPLRNKQFVFDHTSIDHTRYESVRRAIYLPIIRNNVYTLFEQFDFPDPTMPTGSRNSTVVAPQALLLMNSDLVLDSADHMARMLVEQSTDGPTRVKQAYERAVGRAPNEVETQRALAFIGEVTSTALTGTATVDPLAEQRAWSLFCQSLLASNEFMYVR